MSEMTYKQTTFSYYGVEIVLTYNGIELIIETVNTKDLLIRVDINGYEYDCWDGQWKGFITQEVARNIGVIIEDYCRYFDLSTLN